MSFVLDVEDRNGHDQHDEGRMKVSDSEDLLAREGESRGGLRPICSPGAGPGDGKPRVFEIESIRAAP